MMHTIECPETERLRDLLDGMTSESDQAGLTRHLDCCPGCQQRLEMLAVGGTLPAGIARLGRWRSEAGPGLAHAITALTCQDSLDTPPAEDEPILDFLTPSEQRGSMGRFGPYEILDILGHGGMGVVRKALDPDLNRVVALKVLAPQLAASAAARQRFAREGRAAAAIDHANVVRIHAVDSERGLPIW